MKSLLVALIALAFSVGVMAQEPATPPAGGEPAAAPADAPKAPADKKSKKKAKKAKKAKKTDSSM